MTRTATRRHRRALRPVAPATRNHWVQLAARAARTSLTTAAAAPAPVESREWTFVCDDTLTDTVREEINTVLAERLANPYGGDIDPHEELGAAYHAGYPLTAAWLILSGTEAPELGEVLERHHIAIDPHRWDDGWTDFADTYEVTCPACDTRSYGQPQGVAGKPADATWPTECVGCNATLPTPHYTDTCGGGTAWWANCSCGWETPNAAKAERYAKGAATRHLNTATAATAA